MFLVTSFVCLYMKKVHYKMRAEDLMYKKALFIIICFGLVSAILKDNISAYDLELQNRTDGCNKYSQVEL